jgi:hypothetical protein
MKSFVRGKNRAATLSMLGFRPVKALEIKRGSFRADNAERRLKNKGMRYFSRDDGLGIALRKSGAWRLCKEKERIERGHTLNDLQVKLARLGLARGAAVKAKS